jgi:hypothetical protein
VYEACEDVLVDAFSVCILLPGQLGRQDQMVKERLKQSHELLSHREITE